MDLKLHQLRALAAVVDHGGIRAAARVMGLSQAALTKSIRQLEAEAGVAVLVRGTQGVTLTAAGARLHARAHLVIRQLDCVAEEVAVPARAARGSVSVSVPASLLALGLRHSHARFRAQYPLVQLRILQLLPDAALAALRSGQLDLAVLDDDGELPAEFQQQQLCTLRRHAVVRQGHPVLAAPTAEAVARLEWILRAGCSGAGLERFRRVFTAAGLEPPQHLLECDDAVSLRLLASTDAACAMPEPVVKQDARIVRLPPLGLAWPEMRLVMVTRQDVPLTPAAAHLRECLLADASSK